MCTECSEFEWSDNPGAYEAHLARRCNNPYFPTHLQAVSEEELLEARTIDNNDYLLAEERFVQLGIEIKGRPPVTTIAELQKLRERIENLIRFSMGVGGRAYQIATKANRVREAIISDMREAFSDDQNALETIEEADKAHKKHIRKFYIPVMAQILRERSPVRKEDTIATILSEDPKTIALVMSVLPEDTKPLIQKAALEMMKKALDQGYRDDYFEEKVSVL